MEGPKPPNRTFTPTTAYFHDETKLSKKIFEWIFFFAKILQEAMYSQNLASKCKNLSVVWT